MLLWRLSGREHASSMNGGYGLLFDGRWNSVGHALTYAATSPSLCVLEKLVHVEDPDLLPELVMVTYEVQDDTAMARIELSDLPQDWRMQESVTQRLGDQWHRAGAAPLLRVPSAIVPIQASPDMNVLINNRHAEAGLIKIASMQDFRLDHRLF